MNVPMLSMPFTIHAAFFATAFPACAVAFAPLATTCVASRRISWVGGLLGAPSPAVSTGTTFGVGGKQHDMLFRGPPALHPSCCNDASGEADNLATLD